MKSFIEYHFFPYYSFDLDDTLIYFLTGRYEFHNKGIDIFIKALSELNTVLREKKQPQNHSSIHMRAKRRSPHKTASRRKTAHSTSTYRTPYPTT